MTRAMVWTLLALVVAAASALVYAGARALACWSLARGRRFAWMGILPCALAAVIFHTQVWLHDAFALAAVLFAGALLSGLINSPGALVAFLTTGAVVDVISTYFGPTRWLLHRAQHGRWAPLIQFLSISIPLRGQIVSVIGIPDLMFLAVCTMVMRRLGCPEASAFLVPLAGLLAALLVGLLSGFTPAIPFLAIAAGIYLHVSPPRSRDR